MYITWTYITLAIVRDVERDAPGREVDQHRQQQDLRVLCDVEGNRENAGCHVKAGCRHVERQPQIRADQLPEKEQPPGRREVHLADVRERPSTPPLTSAKQNDIAQKLSCRRECASENSPWSAAQASASRTLPSSTYRPPSTARTYSSGVEQLVRGTPRHLEHRSRGDRRARA